MNVRSTVQVGQVTLRDVPEETDLVGDAQLTGQLLERRGGRTRTGNGEQQVAPQLGLETSQGLNHDSMPFVRVHSTHRSDDSNVLRKSEADARCKAITRTESFMIDSERQD